MKSLRDFSFRVVSRLSWFLLRNPVLTRQSRVREMVLSQIFISFNIFVASSNWWMNPLKAM